MVEKLIEAYCYENTTVQLPVIGPKIDLSAVQKPEDVLKAVEEELTFAAGLPEFSAIAGPLRNLAAQVRDGGRGAVGLASTLESMGETSLGREFFKAMALNLRFAGEMK